MNRDLIVFGVTGYTAFEFCKEELRCGSTVYGVQRKDQNTKRALVLRDLGVTFITYDNLIQGKVKFSTAPVILCFSGYPVSDHKFTDISPLVSAYINTPLKALELGRLLQCPVLIARSYWSLLETGPFGALNLYAAIQNGLSPLISYFRQDYKVQVYELFMADTYGTYDFRPKLINRLCRSVVDSSLNKVGSPEQIMAFVYIEDVIRGIRCALQQLSSMPQAFNGQIFPNHVTSLGELVSTIEEVGMTKLRVAWNTRKMVRPVITQAKRTLPLPVAWKPEVALPFGIWLKLRELIPDLPRTKLD